MARYYYKLTEITDTHVGADNVTISFSPDNDTGTTAQPDLRIVWTAPTIEIYWRDYYGAIWSYDRDLVAGQNMVKNGYDITAPNPVTGSGMHEWKATQRKIIPVDPD